MEITSFALFGWSMALASILFFIFIYKKVRRTTATGAGLRNNDGSADPDVKIVGQDEKYKRATWGICIGASIIVGPMLGFALGLAAENGGYPPTQNGDIRSLFWLFSLMALQN